MDASHSEEQQLEIDKVFIAQQAHAQELKRSTAKNRIAKLTKLEQYLMRAENIDKLCEALYLDLRKSRTETISAELGVVIACLKNIKRKLKTWMADQKVETPLAFTGSTSYIRHEPKGCALIISPWNYPFQLAMNPLIYSIAGGCTAMLKPSEFSANTSAFIQETIHHLFDKKEVRVFLGEVETSQALLAKPFDHIYFTGSPAVGKIIMTSAAKHLASVTLELGGKSPCIIDDSVNINKTAAKLVWGKLYNKGQTCIAPDHLYIHQDIKDDFVIAIRKQAEKMYNTEGHGMHQSQDYGRIISDRHFERTINILEDAKAKGANVLFWGDVKKEERYIGLTLLDKVSPDMTLMQEEIFCPILPLIPFTNKEEVVKDILSRPKPLAMYIQSKRSAFSDYIIKETSAGTTVINDFLLQYANHHLPFGGVNNSGMGKSHSINGFLEFTNQRAILKQRFGTTSILHPPYSKWTERLALFITKYLS